MRWRRRPVQPGRERHPSTRTALVLLRRIAAVVHAAPGGARACEIVHHSDAVAQDRLVVPSPELIDPLLDVRLALVG